MRQRLIDEQLQQRRHEVQRGDRIRIDQLRDALRVAVFTRACQQQTAAGDQWPEALPHRDVEADRCLLHQHVAFIQCVGVLHPLQALGQGRVSVADAFGLTGRAGGVNHVRQVVAVQIQARRTDRPVVQVQRVHGDGAHAFGARQVAQQMALGQQQFDPAVLQHVGESIHRIVRVQRHVSPACLEDRQQPDQQLRRTLGGDRHLDVRTNALVAQVMRQAVGLRVQAGEVKAAALPHQCDTFRCLSRLAVQPFRQPQRGRCARRGAPLRLLLLLLGAEQLHVTQRELGLLADLRQQAHIVLSHGHDSVVLEQFVGVIEGQRQATIAVLLTVQLQIELGLAAVPRQLFGQQPRQTTQRAEVALLVVEHDLKQTVLARLRKRFDQLLERHVLMGLGFKRRLPGLGQQGREWQTRVQLCAQHQGVDEEADQALSFMAWPIGAGHTDANVGLPAVTMQQGLEPCQQEHERRRLPGLRGVAHGGAQFGSQAQAVARGAVLLAGRTRMVSVQRQNWLFITQLLLPVSQLTLGLAVRQPFALPLAVIGVTQRQRSQFQSLALNSRGIEAREFVDQHIQRPAIGNDVVQRDQQLMLFFVQLQQRDAQQRAVLQIERQARLLFANCHGPCLTLGAGQIADIEGVQVKFTRRVDTLQGHAVLFVEARTQRFMALDKALEAGAQRSAVQFTAQMEPAGNVVGAAVRVELPEEPQTVLGHGLWQMLIAGQSRDGALRLAVALRCGGLQRFDLCHEDRQRRRFKEQSQAQVNPQRFAQAGHDLGRDNRIAAQQEEMVVGVDLFTLQLFAPDCGDLRLQVRAAAWGTA